MRYWYVANGLVTSDGQIISTYVYAPTHHEAADLARKVFQWQAERFADSDLKRWTENLSVIPASTGAF